MKSLCSPPIAGGVIPFAQMIVFSLLSSMFRYSVTGFPFLDNSSFRLRCIGVEADLVLSNPKLIRKYEYQTNFLGIPVERTDDWYFKVNSKGEIIEQGVGGTNCHQMIGVSYWTAEDGAKLADDLQEVYSAPGGKERYWEQTALVYKKENYKISVRECKAEDIIEIDTFGELKQIDKTYDI